MSEFLPEPGGIYYYGGRGLMIAIGKKTLAVAGIESQETWELREAHDLHTKLSIPVARAVKQLRPVAERDTLADALKKFNDRSANGLGDFVGSGHDTEIQKLIASRNPNDLVYLLKSLTHRYRNQKASLAGIPHAKYIAQAIALLSDELSMTTGLPILDLKEHLQKLAVSKAPVASWPAAAKASRSGVLGPAAFEKIFGISPAQAEDLYGHPPVVHPGKDAFRTIMAYLDGKEPVSPKIKTEKPFVGPAAPAIRVKKESAVTSMQEEKLVAPSAMTPENKVIYDELLPHVPIKGSRKGAFYLAADLFDPDRFSELSRLFFLENSRRSSIAKLASEQQVSEEAMLGKVREHLTAFGNAVRIARKPGFVTKEMIDLCPEVSDLGIRRAHPPAADRIEKAKPAKAEPKAVDNNFLPENLQSHKKFGIAVQDRGPKRGAFDLAARILPNEDFILLTRLYFFAGGATETLENVASKEGKSLEDLKETVREALLVFGTAAREAGKGGYVTKDMIALCGELSDLGVKRVGKRFAEASSNPGPEIHSNETQIYLSMAARGFDARSLAELGSIYEQKGELDKALGFYGSALVLSDGDTELPARIEKLERTLGYTYDSDTHFPVIEILLQERMDDVAGENLDNRLSIAFEDAAQVEEQDEIPPPAPPTAPLPSPAIGPNVVYALPAEIFIPGQRLKMTFNNNSDGGFEVILEVERTDKAEFAGKAVDSERRDAPTGGLDVEFSRHANGATVSMSAKKPNGQSSGQTPAGPAVA